MQVMSALDRAGEQGSSVLWKREIAGAGPRRRGSVVLFRFGRSGFLRRMLAFMAGYGLGYCFGGEGQMRLAVEDIGRLGRGIRRSWVGHKSLLCEDRRLRKRLGSEPPLMRG